jgi:hypothetical protein
VSGEANIRKIRPDEVEEVWLAAARAAARSLATATSA